jgi:hypothetical protein
MAMNEEIDIDSDLDSEGDNKPELIKQAEDLFYALAHNLTHEATNVILQIFILAKANYKQSNKKRSWNLVLNGLSEVINTFENDLPNSGEMKLYALLQEAQGLVKQP